jgi:hypothetical protein
LQPDAHCNIGTRLFFARHAIAAHVAAALQVFVELRVDPAAPKRDKLEANVLAGLHDWSTQVHLGAHARESAATAAAQIRY